MASKFFVAGGAALTSDDDKWTTPTDLFESLDREFAFECDAAASRATALCLYWFGPDHGDESRRDALRPRALWGEPGWRVFLNPPYGRDMKRWMAKASDQAQMGMTIVCLVPARTDTAWWHDYCVGHEIRFLRGRLKFGDGKQSAPFPSAIVVMRQVAGPQTGESE